MSSSTKKRRVEGEDDTAIEGGTDGGGSGSDSSVSDQLKTMSSQMSEMLQLMKGMREEITQLTMKCNSMEELQRKQNTTIGDIKSTLDDRVDERFDDVENTLYTVSKKQKYHDVLLKNQKWEYSAPSPSQEYWNNVLNVFEARSLISQIKYNTKDMRYGNGDDDGSIMIQALIPYDEELLPHWKEFATALEQYQYYLDCLSEYDDEDSKLELYYMELQMPLLNSLTKLCNLPTSTI